MRKVSTVLAAVAILCLIAGPGVAQTPPPASDPAVESSQDVAALPSPQGLSDRLLATFLGLEPAGEPVPATTAQRGQRVLTVPLRLIREGRLAADIATGGYRMSAGLPVIHREFRAGNAEQTETIEAWCGPGELRQMFGWNRATVCMVLTSDGRANLGSPISSYGPWWTASSVSFADLRARTDRVEVIPVETSMPFSLIFTYDRLRDEGISISPRIEGPGLNADDRPGQFAMRRRTLPIEGGAADLVYDGLRLRLTPDQDGYALAVAAERVAPPVDDALARHGRPTLADLTTRPEGDEPSIVIQPFVVGGVKLNPATLTVAAAAVESGGVIASGQAGHLRTGTVTTEVDLGTMLNARVEAGTIVHRVEILRTSPLGARSLSRFWCGRASAVTVFGRRPQHTCFRERPGNRFEGTWPDAGRDWLTTTDRTSTALGRFTPAFAIEESETDLIGPMDVRFEIQRIRAENVTVRLFARREDQDALVQTLVLPIENGRAVLPLWTHRLTLSVEGERVSPVLTADGDGTGLAETGVYP